MIELDLAAFLGAYWHERTELRIRCRNGYRPGSLTIQVGDLDLLIPEVHSGNFLPSILEPRPGVDQALYADIKETPSVASPPARSMPWSPPCAPRAASPSSR